MYNIPLTGLTLSGLAGILVGVAGIGLLAAGFMALRLSRVGSRNDG